MSRTCGEDFAGVEAFDVHRVGKFDYVFDTEHPDGRRCLSTAELVERGFVRNSHGRWNNSKLLGKGADSADILRLTASQVGRRRHSG